ncbi:ribonuclease H-like domain-containing protein [Tanacetum coccineum]
MVTRFRVGTNRPTKRLNLHVSSVSPLPKSYRDAFNDLNWLNAMRDEYIALIKNKTWTLVPRPSDTNIVYCMWLFRHKYLADGTLSRYKARLVANGSTQLEGVDVDETFSSVVKPASSSELLQSLHQEFAMIDLGPLNYFLGISVTRDSIGLFLSHQKYVVEILEKAHMLICNPSQTPVDTESKLGVGGDPVSDPTLYQSLSVFFLHSTTTLVAILMQIGLGVPLLEDQLLVIVYFLATTSGYSVYGNTIFGDKYGCSFNSVSEEPKGGSIASPENFNTARPQNQ